MSMKEKENGKEKERCMFFSSLQEYVIVVVVVVVVVVIVVVLCVCLFYYVHKMTTLVSCFPSSAQLHRASKKK